MDTQPLFGEESREQKLGVTVGTFSTIAWVVYCTIIGVVFGILRGHIQHVLFGALIVVLGAIPYLLYRWYRNDDLDPKFKWLTIWAFITLWFAGVIVNLYVWTDKPYVLPCGEGQFVIYNYTSQAASCWSYSGCSCWSFQNMTCIDCPVTPPTNDSSSHDFPYQFF